MSITLSLFAGAGAQFFDNNGNPLSGGKIYSYAAGTTTPLATYTTISDSAFHTNPIILDAAGRIPSGGEIWLQLGVGYKFVVNNSANVLIATYDNIPSAAQPPAANDADSIMYEQGYTVTAGNFVVGKTYRILTVGTTNYTLIGSVSNTIGTHFVATGVGSGTGTAELSQTVEQKLQQYLSVLDFGATGNGVTDDTIAFTAAISAAAALNRALYVPGTPDSYLLSNELTIPTGMTVSGDGWKSRIKQSTVNKNIFIAGSFTKFDGLHLIGRGAGGTSFATTNCGIYADLVGNFTVQNCFIEKFEGSGIEVRRCHDFRIVNNFFFANVWSTYASGVPGASTADILLYSAAANSSRILIEGNHCLSNNSQGIFVDALGGNTDIVVSNNICITLDPTTCTEAGAWTEIAMPSDPSALYRRHGIVVSYTNNSVDGPRCVVNSNLCRNTLWTGIYKEGVSQAPVVISSNICSDNGYGLVNSLSGGIFAYVDGNELIDGNYIYKFRNTDVSGSGGITLIATVAPTTRSQVKNNTIKSSFNNGIFLGTNSAFVDVINNTIMSSTLCDIVWEAAAASAVVGNHLFANNNILRTSGNLVPSINVDAQASTYPMVIKSNVINGVNNSTNDDNNSGIRVSSNNPQYVEIQDNRIEKFYNGVYYNPVWTGRNFDVVIERNIVNNCAVGVVIKANSNNVTVPLVDNEFPLTTTETDADGFFVAGRICTRENKRLVWETASAVPTVGSWIQGDRANFTAPTAGGFVGGVCVASGTPGTWKTYGAISA